MKPSVRPILILAAFAAAFAMRGPLGDANAERRAASPPYIPPLPVAKIVCAGHRSSFANLLWLNAVPDLSRRFASEQEADELAQRRKEAWLGQAVSVITDLEPTFHTVYLYGSAYYDLVAGNVDKAIEVLQRGCDRNPDDLLLRINLGMTVLIQKQDRKEALRIFQEVVDHPRCDAWSLALCTKLMVDDRQDVAALEKYRRFATSTDEATQLEAARLLERTRMQIYMRAYREFQTLEGRLPTSERELRDPRLMAVPIMDEVLATGELTEDGSVEFPRMREFQFEQFKRAARVWSKLYLEETGEWPTIRDVGRSGVLMIPRLRDGKTWHLHEGTARIIDREESPR